MVRAKAMTRGVKRWMLRQLSKRARPYLQAYGLLKTVKYKTALVGNPGGGKVMVVAPHMDDEVIGCGGTLYKHILKGADATVVFVTDGRYGSKTLLKLSAQERRQREMEVATKRRAEAERALRILGVRDAVFLDAEEQSLLTAPELPGMLRSLLTSRRPDIVYLPCFLEEHADHRAVNQLLFQAVQGLNLDFDCCGYEVWTPLFPNYLVEIGDVIDVKCKALAEYSSQLADTDYVHTALGLNAFRAGALLETHGYVEAFFMAGREEYLQLYCSHSIASSRTSLHIHQQRRDVW